MPPLARASASDGPSSKRNSPRGESILVPQSLTAVAKAPLGLGTALYPVPLLCMLVVMLLGSVYLTRTVPGRHIFAVGSNPDASRYSGLNVPRVRFTAFALCGVGVAIAGILQAASNATANSTAPDPWMLQSIAGVFLGMAMFRNGRPNLPGTILGVLLLRTLDNGLNYTSINDYLQSVISGAAIVIAVLPPALSRLREHR